jgi:hypothetical protein
MLAMISDHRDERFRAYAESHIRINHPTLGELRIEPDAPGRTKGQFPEALDVTIHVVTSHNPGHHLTDVENGHRHEKLARWLHARPQLTVWSAVGGDASWKHTEASFAIVGLSDAEARALGREFDQEAVFAWRITSLDVLPCATDEVLANGWRLRRT